MSIPFTPPARPGEVYGTTNNPWDLSVSSDHVALDVGPELTFLRPLKLCQSRADFAIIVAELGRGRR